MLLSFIFIYIYIYKFLFFCFLFLCVAGGLGWPVNMFVVFVCIFVSPHGKEEKSARRLGTKAMSGFSSLRRRVVL